MGFHFWACLSGVVLKPFGRKMSDDQKPVQNETLDRGSSTRMLPLVAAIGSPMSFLLEIPALIEHWPAKSPRSPLINAALVLSVVLGFMANISLICRYMEYRPQLSTLGAIGSLSLHDFLNVVLLIHVAIQTHQSSKDLPESVCMMMASSIVSSICNLTLIVDYVRVDNFRAKGSGLTTKQRTLAIVAMCLLIYIAFGAMVFTLLETHRSIKYSEAIYFAVCTVTTVGFGDVIPTRTATRVFNFFYAIVGIVLLALTVSTSSDTIIEGFESLFHSRRLAITQTIRDKRLQLTNSKSLAQDSSNDYDRILSASDIQDKRRFGLRSWSPFRPFTFKSFFLKRRSSDQTNRVADPLKGFQEQLHREETVELYTRVLIATFLFSCFWLLGGVVFKFTEGWTYGEALYFGYVAFLTLGYGDYTPSSPGGRAFFIAWSLLGIGNMTLLLAVITQVWEVRYKRAIGKSRKRKLALARKTQTQSFEPNGEETPKAYMGEKVRNTDVIEVLDQLLETAQEFSKHANYWMNGSKGVAPPRLIQMIQETENIAGLEQMTEKGGVIDTVMSQERRQLLFTLSFAKSFEVLTNQVGQFKAAIQANPEQLNCLQEMMDNCENASRTSISQASCRSEAVHHATNSIDSLDIQSDSTSLPTQTYTPAPLSPQMTSVSTPTSAVRNGRSTISFQRSPGFSPSYPPPANVPSNLNSQDQI